MGILNDDAVLIEPGKNSGDPTMVTVNCPDESGLGSTLCRIILEFGLSITKAGIKSQSLSLSLQGNILCFVGYEYSRFDLIMLIIM